MIPTFNRENEIVTPISSVLAQSFQNWEMIVVDDGSLDHTGDVVRKYTDIDKRITFVTRPKNRTKGANACRNIGMEKAQGKYVAFLDSDDEWMVSRLSDGWDFIQSHQGVKGIHENVIIDDGENRRNGVSRDLKQDETYVDFIFSDGVLAQTSTFMVDRESAMKVKFDEGLQRHQDMDFFIRFGKAFGWHFSESRNTIVHWPKGVKRKQHFESMVLFYERYKLEVSSADKLARYLVWAWVCAQRSNNRYKTYYLSELKSLRAGLSIKYRIFRLMPGALYFLWSKWRAIG